MAASLEERLKQEEQKRRQRRVYSTELINKLLDDYRQGYEIPFDAFFNRDPDLRAANITFKMTQEEIEEYQKCYDDALYFVENYCKFMTDRGRELVTLRDYQKKVIKIVTEEKYIPELDEFGPKNRSFIYLSARQCGKCILSTGQIKTNMSGAKEISIGKIYNKYKKKTTLLEKIKSFLYKIYCKL